MTLTSKTLKELKEYDELLGNISKTKKVPCLTPERKKLFQKAYLELSPNSKECFSCSSYWVVRLSKYYVAQVKKQRGGRPRKLNK